MLEIKITGTLPVIRRNPLPDVMPRVAALMVKSIVMNFLMSGRPTPWAPLKSGGETPLVGTGRMMRTVSGEWTPTTATAGMLSNFPDWFWAHQMGTRDGVLPARPYVLFQTQDVHAIMQMMSHALMQGVHNERIR